MFYFRSLSIFKTVILESFNGKSDIPKRWFLSIYFVIFNGPNVPVLCLPCEFLSKSRHLNIIMCYENHILSILQGLFLLLLLLQALVVYLFSYFSKLRLFWVKKNKGNACSVPSRTRYPQEEHRLSSRQSLHLGGVWRKAKLKLKSSPTMLKWTFSRFIIHLVAAILWLLSRVLTKLIQTTLLSFLLVFPRSNRCLKPPTFPFSLTSENLFSLII